MHESAEFMNWTRTRASGPEIMSDGDASTTAGWLRDQILPPLLILAVAARRLGS